ncbi:hypothetical protein H6G65_15430 [Microcystis elabens FACHB-917]|nr:hypothetical protein [Microcystis elabens FACHB-917]
MDPVTLGLGIGAVRTGLNIFGSIVGNRAEQQEYLNDRGKQQALSVYEGWRSTVEQAMDGANREQNYWRETVQYNQDLAYSRSQRNVDLVKAINQADTVRQTREGAGAQFILSSEANQQRLAEQAMADAVALQQYTVAALKNRASIRANPQAGPRSIG